MQSCSKILSFTVYGPGFAWTWTGHTGRSGRDPSSGRYENGEDFYPGE